MIPYLWAKNRQIAWLKLQKATFSGKQKEKRGTHLVKYNWQNDI